MPGTAAAVQNRDGPLVGAWDEGAGTAMMGWYVGDHMTGWGWAGMAFSSVLFVAVLVVGGAWLIRVARQQEPPAGLRSPEQILAERFARGELTEEQYRRQLATLRDTGAVTR